MVIQSELETSLPDSKCIEIKLLPGEYWWGGLARDGDKMPFSAQMSYQQSLHGVFLGNQACPLLISSKGRYLWSEDPFKFEFKEGWLLIDKYLSPIFLEENHGHLR